MINENQPNHKPAAPEKKDKKLNDYLINERASTLILSKTNTSSSQKILTARTNQRDHGSPRAIVS
jgi:hypothetical protein